MSKWTPKERLAARDAGLTPDYPIWTGRRIKARKLGKPQARTRRHDEEIARKLAEMPRPLKPPGRI